MKFSNSKRILCCECYDTRSLSKCNNCYKLICNNKSCGDIFPHFNNQIFNICNTCIETISLKIKVKKYKIKQQIYNKIN